ncbi:hypothetical protein, conserved [Eimeria maxima]|uniref:AB hydrolase-1 domain-containing protein n=1 Tax=Eimeria maxima TaxID=5804 RepID=U6LW35_EIMMA|nr:hypothetical protein, conserved [Eimeria maxima]CDJ55971.1 hypothetical protein, conserved [Eimeria maxima]
MLSSNPSQDSPPQKFTREESSSSSDSQRSPNALNHVAGHNPMVVFVHQYSIMGGSSSLMFGMATLLAQRGIPAVTFDMRGVNRSTGWKTLTGHRETEDVVVVCSWCVRNFEAKNIVIVGSSAGAPIGGSAVEQLPEIRGYVGIGYVFGFAASLLFRGHYKKILQSSKPKLFIHGDEDGFTSTATFTSYFNSAEDPKEKRIIPKVGHFEMEGPAYDAFMAAEIVKFIDKYLQAAVQATSAAMPAAGSVDSN